jgi:hypothetical protein
MKFPSKYSNGKEVTSAQYLAELICERLAKKNKKDLHYRFWLSPEWEKEYKGQIAAANKLLAKFDIKHIISALSTYHGQKIYSLRAPHLSDMISKESKKHKIESVDNTPKIERNITTYRKSSKSNSVLDKLKEIDDGNITR